MRGSDRRGAGAGRLQRQGRLGIFQTFHFAVPDRRVAGQVVGCSDQQGRRGVVPAAGGCGRAAVTPNCIAIDAPVQAAFVGADVDAFDAVADGPLVFVLSGRNRTAGDPFDQFPVHAKPARNAQPPQVDLRRACVEPQG